MNKQKKKAKVTLISLLPYIVGGVIGLLIVFIRRHFYETEAAASGASFALDTFALLAIFLSIALGYILHIVLHETGHLIAGYFSGYKFVSFSVGSIIIIKQNGTLKIKRFTIDGAAGQCLMSPPEPIDHTYPFTLYYLGGGLMNLMTSGLLFTLYLFLRDVFPYAGYIFIPAFGVGLIIGFMNLLPLKIGGLATDGHIVASLKRNEQDWQAHWLLLTANERITSGERVKNLPTEWFNFSESYDFNDVILANLATMGVSRFIDAHDFCAAKKLAVEILDRGDKLIGLLKNETRCDLLFLEIVGEPSQERKDEIERLFTPALEKYIKASKTHLSKHRLMYAYAKLVLFDDEKAKQTLAVFNKVCLVYPYTGDRESEQELISIIDNLAVERCNERDITA